MANATSPQNTNTKDLDPLVQSTGTSSLKRAVGPIAAAGIGETIANQGVATDVDDAAFTPGTSSVVVAGALADETATDSVDEGDAGALRMTLNRRLITAGQILDDAAFGVATDYVTPIGALADETATDSVDEGDVGAVRMTLDRRLHVAAAGDVAHDAVDAGKPVKIGTRVVASLSVLSAGDRSDVLSTIGGALIIGGIGAVGGDSIPAGIIIPEANSATGYPVFTAPHAFNGASWDRARGNVEATLLASAERTATTSSADQTNYNGRGCVVVFDFTVETDAGVSIVVTVEGKDALSGKYYTLLTSAALVAVGTTVLTVFPGAVAVANLVANALLPRVWRVTCTPADTKRATYSVGAVTAL